MLSSFLRRHAVLTYFVLAFTITWGGIVLIILPRITPGAPVPGLYFALLFLFMLCGPSIAGVTMTAVTGGRAALLALAGRMRKWRLPLRWYAVATLTVPTTVLVVLCSLSIFVSPDYAPGFQPIGLLVGLIAGFFEEVGWTGFALPALQARFRPLLAGLILGLVWAAWHGMADFVGTGATPSMEWALNFLAFCVPLVAYRMLMTWVYNHTESVLLAQWMHACYTGMLLIFSPAILPPASLLWQGVWALLLWAIVVVIYVFEAKRHVQASRTVGVLAN
jgi:membrane protease YdiL (CAAX protease family)